MIEPPADDGPGTLPGTYCIRQVGDRRELGGMMAADRPLAAYALGNLERSPFSSTDFFVGDGPAGRGIVMHSHGRGLTTITLGASEAVAAILSIHPGARRSYLSTATPEQMPTLRRVLHVSNELPMRRMSTTSDSFRARSGGVRRLTGSDARRLNQLYASGHGPAFYQAATIDQTVYYGVFEGPRLVAAAGSHVIAPGSGIAVLGNVFTHPSYRGLGLATLTTSAVTSALLDRDCPEIVLSVDPCNTPAVRAYLGLGYAFGSDVVEARVRRRDWFGIRPMLERRAAAHRGRALRWPGIEVVSCPPARPHGPASSSIDRLG